MDLGGKRFGRLLVVNEAERKHPYLRRWQCQCDCGTQVVVDQGNLLHGRTLSCGCYRNERSAKGNRTHGRSKTAEYNTYHLIKRRCLDESEHCYPRYGGRGITVCDRWRNSFENFLADMGPRPSADHSIERKDNDGPYCPQNCVWATRTEQANNRRTSHWLTWNGKTLTVTQWAQEIGIPRDTLNRRVQLGWDTERALTQPVRKWPSQR